MIKVAHYKNLAESYRDNYHKTLERIVQVNPNK